MARVEEGGLYLEIENATEAQLRQGMAAARSRLAGIDVREAFAAQARVDAAVQAELAWEQGLIDQPDEPAEEDMILSDQIDAAWMAAVSGAGFNPREELVIGNFGLV